MPFFSIIIPTFNRLPKLIDALKSVRDQTFTDYEVIVVDDGSTDGTAEAVGRLAAENGLAAEPLKAGTEEVGESEYLLFSKQFSSVSTTSSVASVPSVAKLSLRIIRQENKGPGAARNAGIRNARGKYVAFLDSDDLWFPWTLETFYKAICSQSEVSFVAGREIKAVAEEKLADVSKRLPSLYTGRVDRFIFHANYLQSSKESIWIGTPAACIRRSCLEEVGGFLEGRMNAEDSDLWLRLGIQKGFVSIEMPPVFIHRITPGSEVSCISQSLGGLHQLINCEKKGMYPGGKLYRKNRFEILSRHIRPGCVGLLIAGRIFDALKIYLRTLLITLKLGQWKFLIGIPVFAIWNVVKKSYKNRSIPI